MKDFWKELNILINKKSYPFTAIIGQEKMKNALIYNIINPSIGGLLIRGEKGTAKSTAVRALADLLPLRNQAEGCLFQCDPEDDMNYCDDCRRKREEGNIKVIEEKMKVIDLPINATEDRVVGTLDIEYAITEGKRRIEPGVLAYANRNILYVDEVNLLDDHIVDLLLDAAAMGVNTIEREGISYVHPSKFIMVGTMNPEEGDLRPQLLDRFGLMVDIVGEENIENRVNIVKRRMAYEKNEEIFCQSYEKQQEALKEKIMKAKESLSKVFISDEIIELAAKLSIELGVDGHRADITMIKTATTKAAFEGRINIEKEDLVYAAELALPHRMRRKPFEESKLSFERIREIVG